MSKSDKGVTVAAIIVVMVVIFLCLSFFPWVLMLVLGAFGVHFSFLLCVGLIILAAAACRLVF